MYDAMLFHTFVEMACVSIAWTVAISVLNSGDIIKNNYVTAVAGVCILIGIFDLVHALAYMSPHLDALKHLSEAGIFIVLSMGLYFLVTRRAMLASADFVILCFFIVLNLCSDFIFIFDLSINGIFSFIIHTIRLILFFFAAYAVIRAKLRTSRKLMEKEEQEKRRHKILISNISDVIAVVDNSAMITYISPNVSADFGWSADEIKGRYSLDFVHPEDRKKVSAKLNAILCKDRAKLRLQCRCLCRNGDFRPAELNAVNMVDDPVINGVLANFCDITYRLKMEEALKKSEEKFKKAFHTSPDSINLNRAEDGLYLEINEGFTKIMGYTREEVIGKTSIELNIWRRLEDRKRLHDELVSKGFVENMEAEFRTRDGQIRTGMVSARAINIDGEDLVLFITRDITEKKQMEKKLLQSEARYRQLVENIVEQVWEVDTKGAYTYITAKGDLVWGLESEKLIGRTPFEFMPEKEAERLAKRWKKIVDSRKPFKNLESVFRHPDGRMFYMESSGVPFFDEKGRFAGYRGTSIDITEKRQIEKDTQALVETSVGILGQQLFDTIAERLCGWLDCECAIIGEIIPGNKIRALAMMLDGKPVKDYTYSLENSPCDFIIRQCYCAYSENICMYFPDDAKLTKMNAQGYVGALLEDSNGRPIGVLCCISRHCLHLTEYTKNAIKIIAARVSAELERKNIQKEKARLETRLRQAQRLEAIGTLAGGIAHDFNNILFPIIGYTEMLMGDMGNNSTCKPGLDAIYAAALRARDLVKQILTFSRHETGQLKLMKIQPVIKEALKLIRSTIPKTIEIHQDIDNACGPVKADPAQIHQIIMNLATNAFHAMEDTGGILNVELRQVRLSRDEIMIHELGEGEYLCLTVSDTGTGMDEETAERIFEPFFTTKEKGRGTGMGLSVVHGIVKRMKGAIRVYTEPGKGAMFNVYIPVSKTVIPEGAHLPVAAVRGGTEHILLVDDEKDIVAMETRMLERLGYMVTSHTSSTGALEIFRANPGKFDLVITDMTMPGLTGDRLAIQLKEIQPDIPILLCTGFSRSIPESCSEKFCINAVLSKPIVMRDLAAKIRELLDGTGEGHNNDGR